MAEVPIGLVAVPVADFRPFDMSRTESRPENWQNAMLMGRLNVSLPLQCLSVPALRIVLRNKKMRLLLPNLTFFSYFCKRFRQNY